MQGLILNKTQQIFEQLISVSAQYAQHVSVYVVAGRTT